METDKQYLQDQQYRQELIAIATSKNDEFIKYLEEFRVQMRQDKALSDELHEFYDWLCSTYIFSVKICVPLFLVVKKIYDHTDTLPVETEELDDSFGKDTYEETYKKLKSFSEGRIRKYLIRYFSHIPSRMFNDICKSIIGSETKSEKFEEVMKKISEIDDLSVNKFRKRINRDEQFESLQNQNEELLSKFNSAKDVDEPPILDTPIFIFRTQNNMNCITNKEDHKYNEEYIKVLKEYLELCEDSSDDEDSQKRLEQQIAQKGLSYCKDIITTNFTLGFYGIKYMLEKTDSTEMEEDIIEKYINEKICHEEDLNLVMEKINCRMREIEKYETFIPLQGQKVLSQEQNEPHDSVSENQEAHTTAIGVSKKTENSTQCLDKFEEFCKKLPDKDKEDMRNLWRKLKDEKFIEESDKPKDGKVAPVSSCKITKAHIGYITKAIVKRFEGIVAQKDMCDLFFKETKSGQVKYDQGDLNSAVHAAKVAQKLLKKEDLDSILEENHFIIPNE